MTELEIRGRYEDGRFTGIEILNEELPVLVSASGELIWNRDKKFLTFDYDSFRPPKTEVRVTFHTLTGDVVYNVEGYAPNLRCYRLRLLEDGRS